MRVCSFFGIICFLQICIFFVWYVAYTPKEILHGGGFLRLLNVRNISRRAASKTDRRRSLSGCALRRWRFSGVTLSLPLSLSLSISSKQNEKPFFSLFILIPQITDRKTKRGNKRTTLAIFTLIKKKKRKIKQNIQISMSVIDIVIYAANSNFATREGARLYTQCYQKRWEASLKNT